MNQFNLGQFVAKFIKYSPLNANAKGGATSDAQGTAQGQEIGAEFQLPKESLIPKTLQVNLQSAISVKSLLMSNLKMNHIASLDRALYIKDLMNLPKNMDQILILLQKDLASAKDMTKLLTTNIDLGALAELIQVGGKEALNKLVLAMANASKQGMTDFSEIKDAMKLVNASISAAGTKDNAQILKSFMLLYLPWLPLQQGVGFELEIETTDGGSAESESSITIMISTRNYGNIMVTLVLVGGNSVSLIINCSDIFPKEDLLKQIKEESKNHSIQSDVVFESKPMQKNENAVAQAKISMSNAKEINPFLLLMAHAVIRHTIEIDNQAV